MDTGKLVGYLKGLRAHNTKLWFDAHRDKYDFLRADFSDFVQDIISRIAVFDPAVRYVTAKEAMYRINRDIRFSKDKTLYKTNFGAGIGPGGKKGAQAGYHFHIDASGTLLVAGGLYMAEPAQVDAIRRSIDRQPKTLQAIIAAPAFRRAFGQLDHDDQLKKPPRGFAPTHPAIDLLKLRHYAAWAEVRAGRESAKHIVEFSRGLYPLVKYLRLASS